MQVRTFFSTPPCKDWEFLSDGSLYECLEAFDESGPGVGGPALGGAEMPNGPSAELHPHSPGPAPLLGNEEEGNDLLRAVAPFLGGRAHPIPAEAGEPEALAPVSMDASSSEDASSSSSSDEVSVSEDEPESEVSSEVEESTPQF
ncbi:unnamed protein product [Victoria cruziana]